MNTALESAPAAAAEQPPRSNTKLNILIGCFSLLFTLALIEIALRVIGFSYRLYPEKLEFGYPDFQTMQSKYIEDPELFWTPKEYNERISKLIADPPQIVFMGDSCTEFGTYDKVINSSLKREFPDRNIRTARIGVAGWASYQGREQMERDVVRIKPKIATIYFGWNDHWLGFGIEDKNIKLFHSPFFSFINKFRFVQFATKAYLSIGKKERADVPQRVSIPDYRDNLTTMVRTAKKNGITPVLIAAPTSQMPGKEPAYLKDRFLVKLEDLVPLHQSYLAVVREVAASEQVPLCDLYADFKTLPQRDLEMRYFKNSGIHLTNEGNDVLGKFLFDCMQSQGLLKDL